MTKARIILENGERTFDIFQQSVPIDTDLLVNSLYPPLPVSGDLVVWGFSILREAKTAGVEELNVVEVEGSPADFLSIALKLENRRDRYSWPEMVKLAGFVRQHDCSSRLGEIEGLVQTTGSFLKRVQAFDHLAAGPKSLVVSSYTDLRTAGKLRNFTEEACTVLISEGAGFSASERRKLLTAVNETGIRDNLDQAGVLSIVQRVSEAEDPLQTALALRYPMLTAMETRVNDFHSRSLRGTGIELLPPPGFEGEKIQFSIRAGSKKELLRKAELLRCAAEQSDELFDLLF
jgi:hypothetical protein